MARAIFELHYDVHPWGHGAIAVKATTATTARQCAARRLGIALERFHTTQRMPSGFPPDFTASDIDGEEY